jgi:hypothetical protein
MSMINTAAANVAATAKPRKMKARPVHVRLHGEPGSVLVIPCDDVVHQPPKAAGTMYLCAPFGTPSGCPRGTDCTEVHASTLKASKFAFHEKIDTWTRVADVPYTRYPAGETLSVAKPNAADELETYAAEHVLATQAVAMTRRPLSHCAHFLWKNFCTRGAECEFIHALKLAEPQEPTSDTSSPAELSLELASQRSSNATTPTRVVIAAPPARRYRHDPYDRSWMTAPRTAAPTIRRNDPYRSPWMTPSTAPSRALSRTTSACAARTLSLSVEDDVIPMHAARSSGSSTPASQQSSRGRSPQSAFAL